MFLRGRSASSQFNMERWLPLAVLLSISPVETSSLNKNVSFLNLESCRLCRYIYKVFQVLLFVLHPFNYLYRYLDTQPKQQRTRTQHLFFRLGWLIEFSGDHPSVEHSFRWVMVEGSIRTPTTSGVGNLWCVLLPFKT